MFVSLDGVIQAPGGPSEDPTGAFAHGGWIFPVADDRVGAAIGDVFSRPHDLPLGRRTYDIFAADGPDVDGEGTTMGEPFTAANTYVLTRGAEPLPRANGHRMRGIDDVAALEQGEGPDLLIRGSSPIYPALLAAGLVDRLVLSTFPVLLGSGKRLFGEGTLPARSSPSITRSRQGAPSWRPANLPVGSKRGVSDASRARVRMNGKRN